MSRGTTHNANTSSTQTKNDVQSRRNKVYTDSSGAVTVNIERLALSDSGKRDLDTIAKIRKQKPETG